MKRGKSVILRINTLGINYKFYSFRYLLNRVPVRRIPKNVKLESDFRVEEQICIGKILTPSLIF